MSACESDCDCGTINGIPHEPDCRWWDKCDENHMCDKHMREQEKEYAYLRNVPRWEVFGDDQAKEEYDQELRDAGRGHLVRP